MSCYDCSRSLANQEQNPPFLSITMCYLQSHRPHLNLPETLRKWEGRLHPVCPMVMAWGGGAGGLSPPLLLVWGKVSLTCSQPLAPGYSHLLAGSFLF